MKPEPKPCTMRTASLARQREEAARIIRRANEEAELEKNA